MGMMAIGCENDLAPASGGGPWAMDAMAGADAYKVHHKIANYILPVD